MYVHLSVYGTRGQVYWSQSVLVVLHNSARVPVLCGTYIHVYILEYTRVRTRCTRVVHMYSVPTRVRTRVGLHVFRCMHVYRYTCTRTCVCSSIAMDQYTSTGGPEHTQNTSLLDGYRYTCIVSILVMRYQY